MKFTKITQIEEFRKIIDSCEKDVYLKSPYGDVYNMKSLLSQYVALGKLLGDYGDLMELYCDSKSDEAKFIKFLSDNPKIIGLS